MDGSPSYCRLLLRGGADICSIDPNGDNLLLWLVSYMEVGYEYYQPFLDAVLAGGEFVLPLADEDAAGGGAGPRAAAAAAAATTTKTACSNTGCRKSFAARSGQFFCSRCRERKHEMALRKVLIKLGNPAHKKISRLTDDIRRGILALLFHAACAQCDETFFFAELERIESMERYAAHYANLIDLIDPNQALSVHDYETPIDAAAGSAAGQHEER